VPGVLRLLVGTFLVLALRPLEHTIGLRLTFVGSVAVH
jgi:hypothetical protein